MTLNIRMVKHKPVEVPEDAGAVPTHADEDAVGFADEQARDLGRVTVQVNLRLHLHLCGLKNTRRTTVTADISQGFG